MTLARPGLQVRRAQIARHGWNWQIPFGRVFNVEDEVTSLHRITCGLPLPSKVNLPAYLHRIEDNLQFRHLAWGKLGNIFRGTDA